MAHRSGSFRSLYAQAQEGLRLFLGTERPVYLMTCPSSGVMEAAVRNLSSKRVLSCCCGAFSERWHEMALATGKKADVLSVPWGGVILPEDLRRALSEKEYDLVTLVHCETSTGVLNPLRELAAVVNEFPGVLLAVDMVSSFSAVPLEMDEWGIDLVLAGVQKALALPPGMAVACISERALKRAEQVPGRGYFLDFVEWERNATGNMTVATPSIGHVYALADKVQTMAEEGKEVRYARHRTMQSLAQSWAGKRGISIVPPEEYRTPTLTCFYNTLGWDLPAVISSLSSQYGLLIDGGYGQFKGKTFRISHMGNETSESVRPVFEALDRITGLE